VCASADNLSPETAKYLAVKLKVAESVVRDLVKAGMPSGSIVAATNWIKAKNVAVVQEYLDNNLQPQDESLVTSQYTGQRDSLGLPNGWGR
jgi:hypothetical protein